jgi:two-component system, sensor histidine kinase
VEPLSGVRDLSDLKNIEAESPRRSESDRAKPRILLVEHDAAVLDSTRLLLKAIGYTVVTALSAAEAHQRIDQVCPDLLLVGDYGMGAGATGNRVIASLRAKAGAGLKAILMTGDASCALEGLQADRDLRVVSKPPEAEQLLTLLTELLADG